MKLDLEANEVQFILNMLGELPTKTNCFSLLAKLQFQAQAQAQTQVEDAKPVESE